MTEHKTPYTVENQPMLTLNLAPMPNRAFEGKA